MATTNIDWVKQNQTKFDINLKGNLCLGNHWKVTEYIVLIDRGTKRRKMHSPSQAQESGTKRGKMLSPCQAREWHKRRENALTLNAELAEQPKKVPKRQPVIKNILTSDNKCSLIQSFENTHFRISSETGGISCCNVKKQSKVRMNMYTRHLWFIIMHID